MEVCLGAGKDKIIAIPMFVCFHKFDEMIVLQLFDI